MQEYEVIQVATNLEMPSLQSAAIDNLVEMVMKEVACNRRNNLRQ
jgi:hypothetical protein